MCLLEYHMYNARNPMQRNTVKPVCLCIIVLLVFGPVATSQIIAENDTQNGLKKSRTLATDGKIQEIIDKIDEPLVRDFMEYLVFDIGQRYTGTYGCQNAAVYIYDQFEGMGLHVRYQNFSAKVNKSSPTWITSQNVEATHVGTDPMYGELIIFNAHYDTAKGTVGANDDTSGTVGVLAAAYALSQYHFKRTMKFVAFSGEEQGLFGSKAYVRELYDQQTPVLVEFNADGIGRATTAEYARKIRLSVTEDTGWIVDILQNMTKEYGFNFDITTFWKVNRGLPFGFSDYFHFVRRGYESVSLWGAEGDPNYHSPADNINNVNFSYLVNMTRHIAATMAILADAEVAVPQIYIAHPRHGKIFYNDTIIKNIPYDLPLIIDKATVSAAVKQGAYPVDKVEFYYGTKLLYTDTDEPYEYMLNKRSMGLHRIRVVVYDTQGNSAIDEMKVFFINLNNI